jgi:SAM-dependent methyltransferase
MLDAFKRRLRNLIGIADRVDPPSDRNGPLPTLATDATIRYLLDEVSDLRILVRDLTSRAATRHPDIAYSHESFSYQWDEIGEGRHLLGDPNFETEMSKLVSRYTDLPLEWFAGKSVLDAGCGNGRWSMAFARLGAQVTAIDQNQNIIAELNRRWNDLPNMSAHKADLLEPLPFESGFDIVWCFGAAHHTGNTRRAVEHVAAVVNPGGRLFLMIYGEPRSEIEFMEINGYVELRRATRFMTFKDRQSYLESKFPKDRVHGYFDAVSPRINDLHRLDEVESCLRDAGFINIRTTLDSRNHHIIAERPAEPRVRPRASP